MVETLGRVHLVTEWIQGGELYNRITQDGPLKEIYAASLFKQLLQAVQHMVGLVLVFFISPQFQYSIDVQYAVFALLFIIKFLAYFMFCSSSRLHAYCVHFACKYEQRLHRTHSIERTNERTKMCAA